MKKMYFTGLLLFSPLVQGLEATLTWVHPTQNEDNSLIPISTGTGALTSTRIEYGTCSGASFGTKEGEVTVPFPATSTTIGNLRGGRTYCFRAFSINNLNDVSKSSNVVTRVMPNPIPKPPTLSSTITVAVNTSWRVRPSGGGYTLQYAGAVQPGTQCLPASYTVNGIQYNVIREARRGAAPIVSICS
jgi:hypothetical protein